MSLLFTLTRGPRDLSTVRAGEGATTITPDAARASGLCCSRRRVRRRALGLCFARRSTHSTRTSPPTLVSTRSRHDCFRRWPLRCWALRRGPRRPAAVLRDKTGQWCVVRACAQESVSFQLDDSGAHNLEALAALQVLELVSERDQGPVMIKHDLLHSGIPSMLWVRAWR